jgi:hypothetical protein
MLWGGGRGLRVVSNTFLERLFATTEEKLPLHDHPKGTENLCSQGTF